MKKKKYIVPCLIQFHPLSCSDMMGLIAPSENIGDGGEGNDDDDPTAKQREELPADNFQWGTLW